MPIDIACKEGCSKCCHLHVSLMTPEVFYIVDKLKKTFSSSALYFIQKSLTHSANKPTKNMLYRDRCIFLGQTSNRCTIYSFRPNACRRFFSDDYRRCEATSGCPDQNSDLLYCSGALVGAFGAAGIEEQLDLESHEMNMALSMVLQDESLFRRWLNREKNIFPVVLWENAGKNFDEVRKIIHMNFR
ncbi:YkgJ family cysteine cluster protein [Yersinia pekkanenii]|nr:YkgJ family cysteine cluster protein [Yersinia pekkanenii]